MLLELKGLLVGLVLAFSPTADAQKAPGMTNAEKIASWKGEKVILLLTGRGPKTWGPPDPSSLPEKHDRKTGAIAEVKSVNRFDVDLVVALDDSEEKVILRDMRYLGFFSEKKVAEVLLGRTLWAKGRFWLGEANKEDVWVRSTSKLTVSRVDFGVPRFSIAIWLRTSDGRELPFFIRNLDARFHLDVTRNWEPTEQFFLQDPRTLYPKWSQAVWKLIEEGEVAIGMTEEMVKVACGPYLEEAGWVLSPSGDKAGPMYDCYARRFAIEDGKVTRYFERR